jgi:hypothetical protein
MHLAGSSKCTQFNKRGRVQAPSPISGTAKRDATRAPSTRKPRKIGSSARRSHFRSQTVRARPAQLCQTCTAALSLGLAATVKRTPSPQRGPRILQRPTLPATCTHGQARARASPDRLTGSGFASHQAGSVCRESSRLNICLDALAIATREVRDTSHASPLDCANCGERGCRDSAVPDPAGGTGGSKSSHSSEPGQANLCCPVFTTTNSLPSFDGTYTSALNSATYNIILPATRAPSR